MKLNQFITESSDTIGPQYLEKFRDEVADEINQFAAGMRKHGFKIEEYLEEPDSDSDFAVAFTNKILDVVLYITIRPGSRGVGTEAYDLEAQVSLNDDATVGGGQTLASEIKTFRWQNLDDGQELIDQLKVSLAQVSAYFEPITDWYFDLTSHYGKVKMYVDKKGADDLVRALAGEFNLKKYSGEVF